MAYKNIADWKPQEKTQEILDAARAHIESVPYKVSARWAFYRVWQDGYYDKTRPDAKKKAYDNFMAIASRARHSDMWPPNLLADETREMSIYTGYGAGPDPDIDRLINDGIESARDAIEYHRQQAANYQFSSDYTIDPAHLQQYFIVVMFEARAMAQQFQTYTNDITLCPFGGQASIPYKYQIAKYLERKSAQYGKPIKVLYFGDKDEAGEKIFEAGREDISKWCEVPLDFVRCGLTDEQVERYQLPENAEKPGFQWEALDDWQAREIINEGLQPYYDFNASSEARSIEHGINRQVEQAVNAELQN